MNPLCRVIRSIDWTEAFTHLSKAGRLLLCGELIQKNLGRSGTKV